MRKKVWLEAHIWVLAAQMVFRAKHPGEVTLAREGGGEIMSPRVRPGSL